MIPSEKTTKLDAKGIKFTFLGYCTRTKAYRLICLETKNIIKIKNVVHMEDIRSIINGLELRLSGRNEGPKVVVVDESSKLPLFDGGG